MTPFLLQMHYTILIVQVKKGARTKHRDSSISYQAITFTVSSHNCFGAKEKRTYRPIKEEILHVTRLLIFSTAKYYFILISITINNKSLKF